MALRRPTSSIPTPSPKTSPTFKRKAALMTNAPFGGSERKEVQQNFPIRTGATAYLFLQHFIKMLRAGGRGGMVIRNTFLSNTDNASMKLRQEFLKSCTLHTVLDCPSGTFQGAGVKTVVLDFSELVLRRRLRRASTTIFRRMAAPFARAVEACSSPREPDAPCRLCP